MAYVEEWMKKLKKNCENHKKVLDNIAATCNADGSMSAIRDAILKHMRKRGLTIYRVAKMVERKVPQRTVYAFLRGEEDSVTETASAIMKALGLTITSKSKVERGRSPKERRKEV